MTKTLEARLTTGTISVEIDRASFPPEDLFGFAERCNPKRSFLFVSKVLGRHIPVRPSAMNAAYDDLAAQIPDDLPGPILFTGMAETAIGMGAGVHRAYGRRTWREDVVYLPTTRHALGTPVLLEFQEEHSHASHHLVHEPTDARLRELVRTARTLVMVDDEASTGKTFVNLHAALQDSGMNFERVVLVTLTDWSDGRAETAIGDHASSVSLISGRYSWRGIEGASVPAVAAVAANPVETTTPLVDRDWGRLGKAFSPDMLEDDIYRERSPAPREQKVLVIGTGEHVWRPFLLAEHLEQRCDVHFSAVTRSPITIGHSIGSAMAFSDDYGLGVPNFLYNVDPMAYDKVILCIETPRSNVDPVLLAQLRRNPGFEIVTDAELRIGIDAAVA